MASASPNPNPISRKSLSNAVASLLKWNQSQPKQQKSQLFEADDIIYVILTLARIPSTGRTNPYRIPIPHPLHPFDPESTSICLLLDDRPSSPLPPSTALDQIRTRNLPISFVIGLSDLQSDYRPFESRRKLCDSYDLFFADRKILPLLPRQLGKHFFKRKKIPLAVDCSRAGWAEQMKAWCESSLLYLRTGTCSGLKIGRVNMAEEEIVENAVKAVEGAMEVVPKKWKNLRSVHVKTVESVALPVYQAVPEIGMKIEGVWDDEKEKSLGKRKGREEEGKSARKEKKGRIHDLGVGDGDDFASEDLGGEMTVRKNTMKDGHGKKRKKGVEEREEEHVIEEDDIILDAEDEEEEKFESVMKKGKKAGKAKGKKEGVEEKMVEELSEKKTSRKTSKKSMLEDVVVASDVVKKSKAKKSKGDDNVTLADDLLVKKKVKKGVKGKAEKDSGEEGVVKETGGSDLMEKRVKKKKLEKDGGVASDGKTKQGKKKNQRIKM